MIMAISYTGVGVLKGKQIIWGTERITNNETFTFITTLSVLIIKTTAVTTARVGVLKGK